MNLDEVAAFLRARREQVKPRDLGLRPSGRRRTPGLRREEVAELAGISTEYYAQLEQARGRHPSREVLTSVAEALGMDRHERTALLELAGLAASLPPSPIRTPGPGVMHLLARLPDAAVTVQDAKLDIIAWNGLATALLGDIAGLQPDRRNLARRYFLERPGEPPHFRFEADGQYGAYLMARVRRAFARYPDDPEIDRLIRELKRSDEFRELWESHLIYTPPRHLVKRTEHAEVGPLELDCLVIEIPEDDQQVVMLTPEPGSVSAERLARLALKAHPPVRVQDAP